MLRLMWMHRVEKRQFIFGAADVGIKIKLIRASVTRSGSSLRVVRMKALISGKHFVHRALRRTVVSMQNHESENDGPSIFCSRFCSTNRLVRSLCTLTIKDFVHRIYLGAV